MEPAAARIAYQACPLCECAETLDVMVADCSANESYRPGLPAEQRWVECRDCGHVFVDGYLAPEALRIVFSSSLASQTPGHDVERQRFTWARVVSAVSDLRQGAAGRWLDVGFGSGALLTTAAEFGYEVVGIDTREDGVWAMQEIGYEAEAVPFEQYRSSEPFDVISMADVLEHIPFPKPALRHARDLMRPGGLLFLSMPNSDSFAWQVLTRDGQNPYWGEIEHCHNFGRKRLYALLEECGYQALRYGVSERYRACMEIIARRA